MSRDFDGSGVRRADIAEVLRKLTTSVTGCLVTGATGCGKTTLLEEFGRSMAADGGRLGMEGPVLTVRAALPPALRGIPAGIGSYLLPGEALTADDDSPVSLLSAVRRRLQDLAGNRRRTLLVLDDLQHADDVSLWLVLQLAAAPDVLLLATYNTDQPLPDDLHDLAEDGLLQLHPLKNLEPTQSMQLVEEVLGGEVSLGLAAEIHSLGQGNPALMRAVLEQSLAAGAVAFRHDVWVRATHLHQPEQGLRDIVESRLARRTPQERRAMEILALAEPLPLMVMEQLVPPDVMTSLESGAVIEVRENRLRLVSLAMSGEGEVLRQLIPPARSLELRRDVLRYAGEAGQDPLWAVLRRVELLLDSGIEVPDVELVEAARAANDLMDSAKARRMAGAVSGPDHRLAVELEQARALYYERRYGTAWDQLSRAVEAEENPARSDFVRAAAMLSHIAIQAEVPRREAAEQIRAVRRRFADAVLRPDCALAEEERLQLESRLQLLVMMANARAGQWPDPNQPHLFGAPGRPVRKVEAALLRSVVAEALCTDGRFAEAVEMSALAVAGIVRTPGAILEDVVALVNSYAVVLAWAGQWDQPHDAALQRGVARVEGGVGPWMLPPSLLQEPDPAKGLVPRTRRSERGRWVHNYGGQIQLFRGLVLGRRARWEEALPQLHAAASQLTATADSTFAPVALAAAAFAGWRTGAVSVGSAALGRFDALNRSDPMLVAPMADCFAAVARAGLAAALPGLDGAAVPGGRAAALDVVRQLAEDDADSVPAVRLLARDLLADLELLGPEPEPEPLSKVQAALTLRERSVAALAARGKPSAQIAAELNIAVNTVNAHLRRIYAKLGVSSRRELARRLSTLRDADPSAPGRPV